MVFTDVLNTISICIGIVFAVFCLGFPFVKFAVNRYSPVRTVKAVVIDKYKVETVSRIPGIFKAKGCRVVFLAGKKRLAFDVSEFSYQGYRLKENGTLKYKGSRLIDFS